MQRRYPVLRIKMRLQYGDVAETNDPFGMLPEFFEADAVNDPCKTVASPCAQNCFHFLVIQHLLQVIQSFIIGTRKIIGRIAMRCSAQLYRIAPRIKGFNAGLHPLNGHETSRGNNSYRISFFQVWWDLTHIISESVVSLSSILSLCFTPHLSAKFAF